MWDDDYYYSQRPQRQLFAPPGVEQPAGYGYDVYLPTPVRARATQIPLSTALLAGSGHPYMGMGMGLLSPAYADVTPAGVTVSRAPFLQADRTVSGQVVGEFVPPRRIAAQPDVWGQAALNAGGGYWGAEAPLPPATQAPATQQGARGRTQQQGAGGQGGKSGKGAGTAPPGINQTWWNEFAKEHGGETAEDFYKAQGEGLAEAMADKEWGEGFADMYGRTPTDEDWQRHWYQTRTGGPPRPPVGSVEWQLMQDRRREQRRRFRRFRRMREAQAEQAQRPPLWVPPSVAWQ